MVWEIKHGFRQDILMNAAREKVAVVRRKGNTYLISDSLNQPVYRFEQKVPLIIRFYGANEGFAKIKLAERRNIFLSPRAEYMEAEYAGSIIHIYQTSRRDFVFSLKDKQIGKITGLLKKSTKLEFWDIFPADTAVLFYVFALFMLHADDIDIV